MSSNILQDIWVATDGKFLAADYAKVRIFQSRLHHNCNVLYVANTGNKRVAYISQSSSVFLKPNVMKIDELRRVPNDKGISTNEMQKKKLVDFTFLIPVGFFL